jgi:hypothetical protein
MEAHLRQQLGGFDHGQEHSVRREATYVAHQHVIGRHAQSHSQVSHFGLSDRLVQCELVIVAECDDRRLTAFHEFVAEHSARGDGRVDTTHEPALPKRKGPYICRRQ